MKVALGLNIEFWSLKIPWDLELGTWSLWRPRRWDVEVWCFAAVELAADAAAIGMKTAARNLVLSSEIKLWRNVNYAETITIKLLRS